MKRGVALLSGGLDSAVGAARAIKAGYEIWPLTIDYGQRHRIEIDKARELAKAFRIADRHKIVKVDLTVFGRSSLTDREVELERGVECRPDRIPSSYVPARNTIFLALALALAETTESSDIFIGANVVDYSGYPDCRDDYFAAFETMANLALKATVENKMKINVRRELIGMSKSEIIKEGARLGVDFAMTLSCYDPTPDRRACRLCASCQIRARGFAEARLEDRALSNR